MILLNKLEFINSPVSDKYFWNKYELIYKTFYYWNTYKNTYTYTYYWNKYNLADRYKWKKCSINRVNVDIIYEYGVYEPTLDYEYSYITADNVDNSQSIYLEGDNVVISYLRGDTSYGLQVSGSWLTLIKPNGYEIDVEITGTTTDLLTYYLQGYFAIKNGGKIIGLLDSGATATWGGSYNNYTTVKGVFGVENCTGYNTTGNGKLAPYKKLCYAFDDDELTTLNLGEYSTAYLTGISGLIGDSVKFSLEEG